MVLFLYQLIHILLVVVLSHLEFQIQETLWNLIGLYRYYVFLLYVLNV